MDREQLFYNQKNAWDIASEADKKACMEYGEGYKTFLDNCKTERMGVKYTISLAEQSGFKAFVPGAALKAGDKVYFNNRGKALMLAVIGKKPLSEGVNIAAAHVDSPRLDLKQVPVYEDSELAFFKTHYYGGIKKYQWVTIPMELYGVVILRNGETVEVEIGRGKNDPQLVITDLLPHLDDDQRKKTMGQGIAGESLNLLAGSRPEGDAKDSDRVKYTVLSILNEKYGITEADFLSAELEAVPAFDARDIGLDRSLIGAYGHDDRSCVYAEVRAILSLDKPERTAVCVLADKEEVGSMGVSGMKSHAFEWFIEQLANGETTLEKCFANSFCLSADVCNAFDPNYPEVSEKRNNAKLNYGAGILKFTGARGKSGSNDASAETVGKLRRIFERDGVVWQTGELGKVDQGGGGTVAQYMSDRNIETIDAGVPVLSMHAPFEVVAKMDCYMTCKAVKAVYTL